MSSIRHSGQDTLPSLSSVFCQEEAEEPLGWGKGWVAPRLLQGDWAGSASLGAWWGWMSVARVGRGRACSVCVCGPCQCGLCVSVRCVGLCICVVCESEDCIRVLCGSVCVMCACVVSVGYDSVGGCLCVVCMFMCVMCLCICELCQYCVYVSV